MSNVTIPHFPFKVIDLTHPMPHQKAQYQQVTVVIHAMLDHAARKN